ncbi:ribosome maturation factor RimP [candidate division KSB1 bacterium]|nr:ribosome maturation factor RimP [candidate division KSB1 bacterium]
MTRLEELKNLIEPVLSGMGLDLIDLKMYGQGNRTIVRVYIDQMGGVNIERCTRASRAIEDLLDQKDFFANRYVLEVSSPGTDRPLKSEGDFLRHLGRKVKICSEQQQNMQEYTGYIDGVAGEVVNLSTKEGIQSIPLETILSCKLIVELTDRSSGKRYEK